MSRPEHNTPEYWQWRDEKRAQAMLMGCSFDESCNCFYAWGDNTNTWLDADTLEPVGPVIRQARRTDWLIDVGRPLPHEVKYDD